MIIKAALPLVTAHGGAVTTQQVARAAGIGEATIFRVFADKEALLDAVVAEALRPDTAVAELAAIDLDQPLADRLVEAAGALRAHMDRLGAVIGALIASGHPLRQGERPAPASGEPPSGAREERPAPPGERSAPAQGGPGCRPDMTMPETHEAVAELFGPEADRLRLPPDRLAGAFLGLLFTRQRPAPGTALSTPELVELFLHGALINHGGKQ